jgi:hypothetical protein
VAAVEDYREAARVKTREQFVASYSHAFLVGLSELQRPHSPGRTLLMGAVDRSSLVNGRPRRGSGDASLVILAVRKTQETFPSMIMVGRTANNDVVIEDVSISKFHAFFRLTPSAAELSDAGSRNGTFVRQRRLEPKGASLAVKVGDAVRFGTLDFIFLDAASCWDRLR